MSKTQRKVISVMILVFILVFNLIRPRLLNNFNNNTSGIIGFLSIIIFAIILNELLKLFNIIYEKGFWVALSCIILSVILIVSNKFFSSNEISNKGGYVVYAIISDKHASIKSPNTIWYKYKVKGLDYSDHYYLKDEVYHKLKINDTIIVIFPINSPENTIPYDYFPTPQEIERCKDGCLYKDGEIVGEAK
jgi:hypothetical protein